MGKRDFSAEIRSHFDDAVRCNVHFNVANGHLEFEMDDEGTHLLSKSTIRTYNRAKADLYDLQEGITSYLRNTGQESPNYIL